MLEHNDNAQWLRGSSLTSFAALLLTIKNYHFVFLLILRVSVRSVSCFVRERSAIGELWLAKLPNDRGRSRTQMLNKRTARIQWMKHPLKHTMQIVNEKGQYDHELSGWLVTDWYTFINHVAWLLSGAALLEGLNGQRHPDVMKTFEI